MASSYNMAIRRGSARDQARAVLTIARYVFIACKHNSVIGGPSMAGGTTYGAVDSPRGPSMAAIVSPEGPTMATKFAVDGPGRPILGGPPVA